MQTWMRNAALLRTTEGIWVHPDLTWVVSATHVLVSSPRTKLTWSLPIDSDWANAVLTGEGRIK